MVDLAPQNTVKVQFSELYLIECNNYLNTARMYVNVNNFLSLYMIEVIKVRI